MTVAVKEVCPECDNDHVVVERGGGVVSITCPACSFSAATPEEEVQGELDRFFEEVGEMAPEDRKWVLLGAAGGLLKGFALFLGAIILNGIDGGRTGLGR